jgi:DNA-binding response OmpR family regulator
MPRILVIDDDPQMLELLRRMLERAGYEVFEAPDGRKGLRVCQSTRIDLVITDIIMPDMEGLAVIMELRREFADMKIIAISGYAHISPEGTLYLALGSTLGADRTFTKPLEREELLRAVRDLVE